MADGWRCAFATTSRCSAFSRVWAPTARWSARRSRRAISPGATTATGSVSGTCSICWTSSSLPASHNVNSLVFDECPQIADRIRERGDEVIGHGRTNAERQDHLFEADEARLIAECTEELARHTGSRPRGWLGPYLAQSQVTLDLLKEAGYAYVMDWPFDDQPIWMRTRSGPILAVPYSIEVNDSPALVFRQHSARDFEAMIVDHFDEMLLQSQKWPLVCSIVLHPFIIGQPFRLRALRRALAHILEHRAEIWLTTPGQVADYCMRMPKGTIPGS